MAGKVVGVCAAVAALAFARGAWAAPDVQVGLGPAVQARADELGQGELDGEARYLQHSVAAALARGAQPYRSARLVIADIAPTRPTSAELGTSASLNAAGSGLGGAAVTGEVVGVDGRTYPVRFRDFALVRSDQTDFTTWGDADQAFDSLAAALGRGKVPDEQGAWPPPRRSRTLTGTRIPG